VTHRFLIKRAMEAASPWVTPSALSEGGLPTDLQLTAARRLGLAALVYAAVYFLADFVAGLFYCLQLGLWRDLLLSVKAVIAWTSILLSVGLFVLSRWGRLRPAQVLNLGLVYLVVGALGIAGTTTWDAVPKHSLIHWQNTLPGVPWECVWILIYPLIAPNRPGKILVASLLAASMGPLVLFLSRTWGETDPNLPLGEYLWHYLFSTYLCAVLAWFVSKLVYRLGRHIREAREVGSYQLVEKLGSGGMGEVWRGRHQMLARPAAIKLIRPEVLSREPQVSEAILERFAREAQITATLQSYHTVNLYDFGITDEGIFYFVMELFEGLDLDRLVRHFGPVPAARTVHFLRQACHSLAEAHHAGLIHRDIKPANLFACRLGLEYDFIKILDFGIVKTGQDYRSDLTQLTQEGIACGTPGYIAPELALGKGPVDGRADLYALGCVGYWLLTGQKVFAADNPVQSLLAHVQEEPAPPSQRTELPVPPDLDRVILDCLAKDPAQRPASALVLGERLAACRLDGPWTAEDSRLWWETHLPLPLHREIVL
jgi:tRNA A-37 threonylcarbamoyl transferase component Bud32